MKIKVPKYVLQYNLDDRELVFACFIGYVAKKEHKNVVFNMWADDAKHILGYTVPHPSRPRMSGKPIRIPAVISQELQKVFRIGILNQSTWRISVIEHEGATHQNGSLIFEDVEITDTEALHIYYYLAGRASADNIIESKDTQYLKKKKSFCDVALKGYFRDNFML